MNIYILTSDKSIDLVEGLQYCVNKYWNPNPSVIILGYKKPLFELDDNFKFVSLGEDRGPDSVGEDLINFFNTVDDEHFIFSVDDFFPIRHVDTFLLGCLENQIINENISRIALTDQVRNKPHSVIMKDLYHRHKIIEMEQLGNYRISAVWSMWSKEYFLKYLTPTTNLWQWEMSSPCKKDNHRIIGTKDKYVLQSCHLVKRGKLKRDWYKDSESADVMVDGDIEIVSKFIGEDRITEMIKRQ